MEIEEFEFKSLDKHKKGQMLTINQSLHDKVLEVIKEGTRFENRS